MNFYYVTITVCLAITQVSNCDASYSKVKSNEINVLTKNDKTTIINSGLRLLIEGMRKQMTHGYPRFGVPRLAPYLVPYHNFSLGSEQFMRVTAHLKNFSISNLNKFDVHKLEFHPMKLFFEMELIFPELVIDSMYSVTTKLLNATMQHTRNGNVKIRLKDIGIHGRAKLNLINKIHPNITELVLNVSMNGIKSNITNLIPGQFMDEFINRGIEQAAPVLLENVQNIAQSIMNGFIIPELNKILTGVRFRDVINYLMNLKGKT